MNSLNNTCQLLLMVALAVVLFSASCSSIKEIEYLGMKDTKLESLSLSSGIVKTILQYNNPNNFGLDIKETNLEVYVNDKYLGIAENPEKMIIPKSSVFDFPIRVHFNPIQVLGIAFKNSMSKEVTLRVKGTAKLGKQGVFMRVPIDVQEKVNIR